MAVLTLFKTDRAHTALPRSARRAVAAMYVGLALTVIAMIVPIVEQTSTDTLSRHLHDVYAGYDVDAPAASAVVAYLVTIGGLGIVAWLWTLWAIRRRKRWVRPAATALFLLAGAIALADLTVQEYGRTILPTQLGLVGLLPCIAGLLAVILLWMRE
jgi:hypothetical protein